MTTYQVPVHGSSISQSGFPIVFPHKTPYESPYRHCSSSQPATHQHPTTPHLAGGGGFSANHSGVMVGAISAHVMYSYLTSTLQAGTLLTVANGSLKSRRSSSVLGIVYSAIHTILLSVSQFIPPSIFDFLLSSSLLCLSHPSSSRSPASVLILTKPLPTSSLPPPRLC